LSTNETRTTPPAPDRLALSRVAALLGAGWAVWLALEAPALARSAAEDIMRPLTSSELAL
jgi:hypothetical protein